MPISILDIIKDPEFQRLAIEGYKLSREHSLTITTNEKAEEYIQGLIQDVALAFDIKGESILEGNERISKLLIQAQRTGLLQSNTNNGVDTDFTIPENLNPAIFELMNSNFSSDDEGNAREYFENAPNSDVNVFDIPENATIGQLITLRNLMVAMYDTQVEENISLKSNSKLYELKNYVVLADTEYFKNPGIDFLAPLSHLIDPIKNAVTEQEFVASAIDTFRSKFPSPIEEQRTESLQNNFSQIWENIFIASNNNRNTFGVKAGQEGNEAIPRYEVEEASRDEFINNFFTLSIEQKSAVHESKTSR